jgi:nucleotide-binding universal stress UspA family protein
MKQILIPSDFSANAKLAEQYAITIFGSDAEYTLLNSFEVPHSGATMLISIADILQKDADQLLHVERDSLLAQFPDLTLKTVSAIGQPAFAIKKHTQTEGIDVVVMGTKGATGLKGILIGSVAANTMSELKCPVITVPESTNLVVPKKILFAADDQCLTEGKLPDELVKLANKWGAEVLILNVVAPGEMKHVGNATGDERKPIGVFENVNHSIHFISDADINSGIQSFMKEHKVDLLAMITRKTDLISNLFGLSNTKGMMMTASLPLMAFHQ